MMLIRRFEERAGEMYAKAKIGGFLHLCDRRGGHHRGRHAGAARRDYLMSTYREHGQALARGTAPNAVMAELFGREDGCSGGRGGSMHLFDWDKRFLGGYGIVGGSLPLSAGVALAGDYLGDGGRDPLDDGRRRDQPGHLRRDDEPRGALEAAGRLRDHQQPVRHGHRAAPPLGGHRPVAQVRGLRRARHALRRHGRARRAQRGDRGAEVRPRGAQAAARRGGHLPLPRPLDGRPRGVPLEGRGRGVARARSDQGVRQAPRRRGRAGKEGRRAARPGGDRDGRRGGAFADDSPFPDLDSLYDDVYVYSGGARLVDRRRALPRGASRRARARGRPVPHELAEKGAAHARWRRTGAKAATEAARRTGEEQAQGRSGGDHAGGGAAARGGRRRGPGEERG